MILNENGINIDNYGVYHKIRCFNINLFKPYIDKGLIIYGAGSNCIEFLISLYIQNTNIDIKCVIDKNDSKIGKKIFDIPIISLSELKNYDRNTPILISIENDTVYVTKELESLCYIKLFYYDKNVQYLHNFRNRFLNKKAKEFVYDFAGAIYPDVEDEYLNHLISNVCDYFYLPGLTEFLYTTEGSYEYSFNNGEGVTLNTGDIVIDAGAYIGDFSAFAASKGCIVHAFEPTRKLYKILKKTAMLNKPNLIYAYNCALGDSESHGVVKQGLHGDGSNSIETIPIKYRKNKTSTVQITSIDKFVDERKLSKVDFIKADIEGYERNLLIGAANTIRKYTPKLSICTYHKPDDPRILEDIVLSINPNYKVHHSLYKMFAWVDH
ncbi:MAG: FkbM family methyltransferase [Oscillospiraceae bacterium]|jgi:FkbM family methyltransferase|nr:FkbM family methyltransferase [Oscillospiraceae bacterium]